MIKYLIAFLLIYSPCLAGMGIGGFPQPGPGYSRSGGTTYIVHDSFTEASNTTLASHLADTGESWVKHPSYSANITVSSGGFAYPDSSGSNACYYINKALQTADYTVESDFIPKTSDGFYWAISARMSSSVDTMYLGAYNRTDGKWYISKRVSGSNTNISSYTQSLTNDQTYNVKFVLAGTSLKLYIDDVLRVDTTDSSITSPGYVGIRANYGTQYTGYQYDSIKVY